MPLAPPAAPARPKSLRPKAVRCDLARTDWDDLRIVLYPDPRLRRISRPVRDDEFGPGLVALAARMFQVMRDLKGVGLAAPQVGLNVRLFVMNPTGEPADDRAYVNPVLNPPEGTDDGDEEAEEGCLSLPNIHIPVLRSKSLRLTGRDPAGAAVDVTDAGFATRIWQHEADHLDGVMLVDKMSPVGKLTFRKTLREMEEAFGREGKQPRRREGAKRDAKEEFGRKYGDVPGAG